MKKTNLYKLSNFYLFFFPKCKGVKLLGDLEEQMTNGK